MRNVLDYYDHDAYLEHHGIKGQKWGVRRFQNPDGTLSKLGRERALKNGSDYTISKNTTLYRTSYNPKGYNETSSRVYVSGNKKDNKKWKRLFDKSYPKYMNLYDVRMKTLKDIKVAGETAIGEAWLESIESEPFRKQAMKDITMLFETRDILYPIKDERDLNYNLFSNTLGYHTKSGDDFMRFISDVKNYDAMVDYFGRHTDGFDVSEPLIILHPQDNIAIEDIKKIRRHKR